MKVSGWLVITKTGRMRMVTNRPALRLNEFASKLVLNVPDSVFERYFPTIEAELTADSFVKPEAKVEVEEVDDEKLAVEIKAQFEAQGLDYTLTEIADVIKCKRQTDAFFAQTDKEKKEK